MGYSLRLKLLDYILFSAIRQSIFVRNLKLKLLSSGVDIHRFTYQITVIIQERLIMSNKLRQSVEWNTKQSLEDTFNNVMNRNPQNLTLKVSDLDKKHCASSKKTLLSCFNFYKEYLYLKNFISIENSTLS